MTARASYQNKHAPREPVGLYRRGFRAMNRTLFDCRIKRKVEARNGELFDITATLPKTVGLSSKLVKCHHCNALHEKLDLLTFTHEQI